MWRKCGKQVILPGIAVLVAAQLGLGCGLIADTDRKVVAKLDGKTITRGDLNELIYHMDDDERPIIRGANDYLRVLNQHIDKQIKIPLGQQMAESGQIKVDREVAREQFFKSSGDKEAENRHMWETPVPKPGEETELMKIYNLRAEDIQAMKNIIEQETDRIVEQMQADQAVSQLAMEAFKKGELTLDQEALKLEYEVNKEKLHTFEGMTFLGIQFPASAQTASADAARVRERLDAGEDFDAVLAEFLAMDMRFGVESDIENNPEVLRFQTFWDQVSGSKTGEIKGPIFMPEYTRMRQGADGKTTQEIVPASYLVFKILEYREARTLTLEEATPFLAGPIAYAEMMKKLREQHGVEIFEENLDTVRGGDKDPFED